jgi:hypothetical protein
MSISAGVERSYNVGGGGFVEQQRAQANVAGTTLLSGLVTGQTISIYDVASTFTTATTVVNVASILLPRNLPIYTCGCSVTTVGTVTGFWQGIATQGGIVRAVSANVAATSLGYFNQSVLPASLIPYVTEYAGLYYYFVGTVSSVATVLASATAFPANSALGSGPPVYCGTAATAATTTPPALGSSLGALTGTVGGIIYGQTA